MTELEAKAEVRDPLKLLSVANQTLRLLENEESNFVAVFFGFVSIYSFISNVYIAVVLHFKLREDNCGSVLNLAFYEITCSLTSFLLIALDICPLLQFRIRTGILVIGLFSVAFLSWDRYAKVLDPFSNFRLPKTVCGVIWTFGGLSFLVVHWFGEEGDEDTTKWVLLYALMAVILLAPTLAILLVQALLMFLVIQNHRAKKRGHITLSRRYKEAPSNGGQEDVPSVRKMTKMASVSSSGGEEGATDQDTMRIIVIKSKLESSSSSSSSIKNAISCAILFVVFMLGQFTCVVITLVSLWHTIILDYDQRLSILSICQVFMTIAHPLVYGILRENFRFFIFRKTRYRLPPPSAPPPSCI